MVLALSVLMSAAKDQPIQKSFDAECCEAERDYAANTLEVLQAEGSTITPRITALRHDINADGKTDFLAKIENPPNCGSGGCEVHLFTAGGDGNYQPQYLFNTAVNDFEFTPSASSAFMDIRFQNGDSKTCTWSWGEGNYHFKGCDTL